MKEPSLPLSFGQQVFPSFPLGFIVPSRVNVMGWRPRGGADGGGMDPQQQGRNEGEMYWASLAVDLMGPPSRDKFIENVLSTSDMTSLRAWPHAVRSSIHAAYKIKSPGERQQDLGRVAFITQL